MGVRDADQRQRAAADVPGVRVRPLVVVPVFALISLVGALFPAFSVGANVMVLACGGALFWLGTSARVSRSGSPRRPSTRAGWWLLPVLVLAVVELVDLALGSTYDHPTLSGLADPLLERYPARAAAYFGWLTAYWRLVRS